MADQGGSRPPSQILMEIQSCGEAAAEQVMSSLDALFDDNAQTSANVRGLTILISSLLRQSRDDHHSHLSYLAQAEDKLKKAVRALQERWQKWVDSDPELSGHVKIAGAINKFGAESRSTLDFWTDIDFEMEQDDSVGGGKSDKQTWLYKYKPKPERHFILLKRRYDRQRMSAFDAKSASSVSTTNPQTATTVISDDPILPDIRTLFESTGTAIPESNTPDASSQYTI